MSRIQSVTIRTPAVLDRIVDEQAIGCEATVSQAAESLILEAVEARRIARARAEAAKPAASVPSKGKSAA